MAAAKAINTPMITRLMRTMRRARRLTVIPARWSCENQLPLGIYAPKNLP